MFGPIIIKLRLLIIPFSITNDINLVKIDPSMIVRREKKNRSKSKIEGNRRKLYRRKIKGNNIERKHKEII